MITFGCVLLFIAALGIIMIYMGLRYAVATISETVHLRQIGIGFWIWLLSVPAIVASLAIAAMGAGVVYGVAWGLQ